MHRMTKVCAKLFRKRKEHHTKGCKINSIQTYLKYSLKKKKNQLSKYIKGRFPSFYIQHLLNDAFNSSDVFHPPTSHPFSIHLKKMNRIILMLTSIGSIFKNHSNNLSNSFLVPENNSCGSGTVTVSYSAQLAILKVFFFSHHYKGSIDVSTVNINYPKGMYFLIHSLGAGMDS